MSDDASVTDRLVSLEDGADSTTKWVGDLELRVRLLEDRLNSITESPVVRNNTGRDSLNQSGSIDDRSESESADAMKRKNTGVGDDDNAGSSDTPAPTATTTTTAAAAEKGVETPEKGVEPDESTVGGDKLSEKGVSNTFSSESGDEGEAADTVSRTLSSRKGKAPAKGGSQRKLSRTTSGSVARQRPLSVAESAGVSIDDWVSLNVGGRIFTTTRRTLTILPDSMLESMFRVDGPAWSSTRDSNGCYLLDRDPEYFGPVLNFLRTGNIVINPGVAIEGVLEEARFFQVTPLIEHLESVLHPPVELTVYQYLVVKTITLYYSGKARTNISIDGPLSRGRRRQLSQLDLNEIFNRVGNWGWRLVSSSGKGGDQEKFVFEKARVEAAPPEALTSPLISPSQSDDEIEIAEEIGLPYELMQQAQQQGLL